MVEDAVLLEAWRAGDRDAANELLNRHIDGVQRFFQTKVSEDVEELVQRTFLDCVESRDRVPEKNFRAYLFGIARHRLVDHLREKTGAKRRLDTLRDSLAELKTSPSGNVARSEEQKLLLAAMRRLPIDFQIALELAYWEELSGPEIAQVLGIPENTVRSRLSRARQQLRVHVEELASSPSLVETTLQTLDKPTF